MKKSRTGGARLEEISINFEEIAKDMSERRLGRSVCFLCAKKLTSRNRSDEHVFPKWMQTRFDLTNQEIILLNGTVIPYRQLTIPCCRRCNNTYLARIERA